MSELSYPLREVVQVAIEALRQALELSRSLLKAFELQWRHFACFHVLAPPVGLSVLEPDEVRQRHNISHLLEKDVGLLYVLFSFEVHLIPRHQCVPVLQAQNAIEQLVEDEAGGAQADHVVLLVRRFDQRHREVEQRLGGVESYLEVGAALICAGHLEEVLGDRVVTEREESVQGLAIVALLPPTKHLLKIQLSHVHDGLNFLFAVSEDGVKLLYRILLRWRLGS